MSSRTAHHVDFTDSSAAEWAASAGRMLQPMNDQFGADTAQVFDDCLARRLLQPHFANARSVRNALDRARLHQASPLFAQPDRELAPEDLTTMEPADLQGSRVFQLT